MGKVRCPTRGRSSGWRCPTGLPRKPSGAVWPGKEEKSWERLSMMGLRAIRGPREIIWVLTYTPPAVEWVFSSTADFFPPRPTLCLQSSEMPLGEG